jgi:hypothetical protein
MGTDSSTVPRSSEPAACADEQVSPELALIDPALRDRLLAAGTAQPFELGARVGAAGPAKPVQAALDAREVRRAARSATRVHPAALCAAALILAFAAGAFVSPDPVRTAGARNSSAPSALPVGRSRSFAPPAITSAFALPGAPTPGSKAIAPRAAGPGTGERRFAWAPAAGASAYEVALYKGNVLVFGRFTREPAIEIPVRRPRPGASPSVAPGTYEWYVWPIRAGVRDAVAVVRSRLVLAG